MSDGVTLAQEASSRDPAVGLRAVRALRELAERLEALQVASARDQGWSWQDIAVCLGVSRQAVHKKHGGGRRLSLPAKSAGGRGGSSPLGKAQKET
ncbi:RNA polymerase subunit sigma-70 [Actinomadura physcomitrii]|uniref:RNA polymerase subunit sigma-70 n=1 Tax=Actinomadura physcomitrii TaxID=2650748 RepID=UPI001F1B58EB|nr:RNA polymerase subunit sigma-70 [Actinomadura physcomitrii]